MALRNMKGLCGLLALASLITALVLEGLSSSNYPNNEADQSLQKQVNVSRYHNWALVLMVASVSFGLCGMKSGGGLPMGGM